MEMAKSISKCTHCGNDSSQIIFRNLVTYAMGWLFVGNKSIDIVNPGYNLDYNPRDNVINNHQRDPLGTMIMQVADILKMTF